MNVTVASCTSRTPRVGRIGHVKVDQTAAAGEVASYSHSLVTTYGSNGDGVVELLVDLHDVRLAYMNSSIPVYGE